MGGGLTPEEVEMVMEGDEVDEYESSSSSSDDEATEAFKEGSHVEVNPLLQQRWSDERSPAHKSSYGRAHGVSVSWGGRSHGVSISSVAAAKLVQRRLDGFSVARLRFRPPKLRRASPSTAAIPPPPSNLKTYSDILHSDVPPHGL
jgi:hypothetical protein